MSSNQMVAELVGGTWVRRAILNASRRQWDTEDMTSGNAMHFKR